MGLDALNPFGHNPSMVGSQALEGRITGYLTRAVEWHSRASGVPSPLGRQLDALRDGAVQSGSMLSRGEDRMIALAGRGEPRGVLRSLAEDEWRACTAAYWWRLPTKPVPRVLASGKRGRRAVVVDEAAADRPTPKRASALLGWSHARYLRHLRSARGKVRDAWAS